MNRYGGETVRAVCYSHHYYFSPYFQFWSSLTFPCPDKSPQPTSVSFCPILVVPLMEARMAELSVGTDNSPPPSRYSTATRETSQVSAASPPLPAGIPKQPGKNPSHPSIPQTVWSTTWAKTKGKKTKPKVVLHSYRISVQCWTDFRLFSRFHKNALYESGATDSHLGGPQLTIPHQKIQQ